jgi:Uma2 family endonuclease
MALETQPEYRFGGKFAVYRTLPSLREYVLVAQDRLSVEVFTRQDAGRWLLTAYSGPDDEAVFDSLQCSIPLREIYEGVQFETAESRAQTNDA